jgi:hypothetical protein
VNAKNTRRTVSARLVALRSLLRLFRPDRYEHLFEGLPSVASLDHRPRFAVTSIQDHSGSSELHCRRDCLVIHNRENLVERSRRALTRKVNQFSFLRETPPAFGDRSPGSHRPLASRCGGRISTVLPTYLTYHYLLSLLKLAGEEAVLSCRASLPRRRGRRQALEPQHVWRPSAWVTNRRPRSPRRLQAGSPKDRRFAPSFPRREGLAVSLRAHCRFSRRLEHAHQR